MVDKDKIDLNVEAGIAARLVAEMAKEEGKKYGRHFWSVLRSEIGKFLPRVQVIAEVKTRKMTNEEAKVFGNSRMPFGEYKGMRVDDVRSDWLVWLADQTFQEDLRRYLNSDRFRSEL